MKKIIFLTMLICFSIKAFTQNWNHVSKSNFKNLFKSNQKQTRSANERCVELSYYTDTSINGMPLVLNSKQIFTYSGNRKSKNIIEFNMIALDVANDCDKKVNYIGLSNPSSDSIIELSNFDNLDRKIFSATTIFNGSGFDTNKIIKLSYSGLNKIEDTIAFYNNVGSVQTLSTLTVNKISNNNIDTTLDYYDTGMGLALAGKNAFKYNTSGQVIEDLRISSNQMGMPIAKTAYIYNTSNNLVDSILEYNVVNNNFVLRNTTKLYFDATTTNGNLLSWNSSNVKRDGARFILNSNKLFTLLESYSFNTPTDSIFESSEKTEFNANGSLTKLVYQSSVDGILPNYYTTDSLNYIYKPFVPLAVVVNTKTISAISCYPNPIQTNANIFYYSTAIKPMQIIIYDVYGKTIYTNTLQSVNGNSFVSIPMQNMQSGIYVCSFFVDGQIQQSIKLQKQ